MNQEMSWYSDKEIKARYLECLKKHHQTKNPAYIVESNQFKIAAKLRNIILT